MSPLLRRLSVSGRAKIAAGSEHAIYRDGFITKSTVEHDNIDAINPTNVTVAHVVDSLRKHVVTAGPSSYRYPHETQFIREQQKHGSWRPAFVY
jgi:hypothetical protein